MNGFEFVLLLLALMMMLVGIAFVPWYFFTNVANPHGKGAHRKTTGVLTRYALIRSFKVLTNVTLSHKSNTYVAENMLIGFFGILIINTLGGRGEYYGQLDGKEWQRVYKDKRHTFPNPAAEQDQIMAALRTVLAEKKLYNIPMEGIVCITSRSKKTALFITHSGRILLPGKLAGYLQKAKFDKDTGLDVTKVVEAIKEASDAALPKTK